MKTLAFQYLVNFDTYVLVFSGRRIIIDLPLENLPFCWGLITYLPFKAILHFYRNKAIETSSFVCRSLLIEAVCLNGAGLVAVNLTLKM